jgi:hypothetical protein
MPIGQETSGRELVDEIRGAGKTEQNYGFDGP